MNGNLNFYISSGKRVLATCIQLLKDGKAEKAKTLAYEEQIGIERVLDDLNLNRDSGLTDERTYQEKGRMLSQIWDDLDEVRKGKIPD